MGIDAQGRPDTPPPPQPKPPQPNPDAHKDWQNRHEQNMKRPEKTPDVQPRGDGQQVASRQAGAVDGRQQPGVRPDAAGRPGDRGRLSYDMKEWRAEQRVVPKNVDANQYRADQKGPVNLERMRADFAKEARQLADQRKASGQPGSGVLVDVRLKNATVGKGSEAMAIKQTLVDAGRKDGILVRVTVDGPGGARLSPGGDRLTPPTPRQPVPVPPDVGGGGPGKPGAPPQPGQPGGPRPPQQPGGPHPPGTHVPPHVHLPPPHVHLPPPDVHRR